MPLCVCVCVSENLFPARLKQKSHSRVAVSNKYMKSKPNSNISPHDGYNSAVHCPISSKFGRLVLIATFSIVINYYFMHFMQRVNSTVIM